MESIGRTVVGAIIVTPQAVLAWEMTMETVIGSRDSSIHNIGLWKAGDLPLF